MTRRPLLLGICALFTLLTASACAELPDKGAVLAAPDQSLVIGVAATLSGPLAAEGEGIVNGVRLAVNRHGPLSGRTVQVVAVDDGCDADQSEAAAQQLLKEPRLLGIVGPSCSPGCVAAGRVLDQPAVPMITPRCTDIAVTRQGYDHVFRTSRTDAAEMVAAATYLDETLQVRRVFLVHDGSIYGRGIRDVFRLVWGKDNLAGNVEALGDTQDYGSVVRAIRASNAGAVYYAGFPEEAARFVQQLREAGVQLPVLGTDTLKIDGTFAAFAGTAAEGVYVTEAESVRGRLYGEFASAYREQFGSEPGPSAAEAYDAAAVLLDAARRTARTHSAAVTFDRRTMKTNVWKADLDGMSGRVRFRDNGDRKDGVLVRVYRIQDGQYVEQALIDPE
jgi:branched-chain amino acid transport system substrate-binding protein